LRRPSLVFDETFKAFERVTAIRYPSMVRLDQPGGVRAGDGLPPPLTQVLVEGLEVRVVRLVEPPVANLGERAADVDEGPKATLNLDHRFKATKMLPPLPPLPCRRVIYLDHQCAHA